MIDIEKYKNAEGQYDFSKVEDENELIEIFKQLDSSDKIFIKDTKDEYEIEKNEDTIDFNKIN